MLYTQPRPIPIHQPPHRSKVPTILAYLDRTNANLHRRIPHPTHIPHILPQAPKDTEHDEKLIVSLHQLRVVSCDSSQRDRLQSAIVFLSLPVHEVQSSYEGGRGPFELEGGVEALFAVFYEAVDEVFVAEDVDLGVEDETAVALPISYDDGAGNAVGACVEPLEHHAYCHWVVFGEVDCAGDALLSPCQWWVIWKVLMRRSAYLEVVGSHGRVEEIGLAAYDGAVNVEAVALNGDGHIRPSVGAKKSVG